MMRQLLLAAGIACGSQACSRAQPDAAPAVLPGASPHDEPAPSLPIGVFSPPGEAAKSLTGAGFNALGPTYRLHDTELIAQAQRLGVKAIYSVGWLNADRDGLSAHSDAQITAAITAQVSEAADSDTVGWWYLMPEELRPYRVADMRFLRVATAAIRDADPRGREIVVYVPNHFDAEAIAPIAEHVDVVAKGAYANHSGHRQERAWVRWSIDQAARTTSLHHATTWVVPEMFAEPPPGTAGWIDRWVTHDVYAGLLAGAQGVLVYSAWPRKGFVSRDVYLQAYRRVAEQLDAAPGSALATGNVAPNLSATQTGGQPRQRFRLAADADTTLPSLLAASRRLSDRSCVWLVNSAMQPILARCGPVPGGRTPTAAIGEGIGERAEDDWYTLSLAPLEVRCLCIAASQG